MPHHIQGTAAYPSPLTARIGEPGRGGGGRWRWGQAGPWQSARRRRWHVDTLSFSFSLSLSLLYSVIYREEGGLLGASITHTQGRYLAIERSLAERPIRRPDDESCGHYLTTGKEEGKNSGQFRPATALTRWGRSVLPHTLSSHRSHRLGTLVLLSPVCNPLLQTSAGYMSTTNWT